ncbi:hypothetical protein MBLNU13_g00516t1 [Cladosporium sp. NU13]
MSSDESQSVAVDMNGHHHAAGLPDVTIEFVGCDLAIQASKSALIAGSTFFGDHFYQHPSSTKVQAPECIRPEVNISFDLLQAAIDYLHGNDISEKRIARHSIPLILAARAFGIFALEDRVTKHLTNKLDHQFEFIARETQILEIVDALRDLYGRLGGRRGVKIGEEVAGIVTGAVAHACCRKFPMLKKSPEFMALMKEVPVLAYDMLASDVEVVPVVKNAQSYVDGEKSVEMGEDLKEVVTEGFVTEVVEDTMEEAVAEGAEEVVQTVEE